MQGRRLPDIQFGDLPLDLEDVRPGDYWKYLDRQGGGPMKAPDAPDNLTGTVWGICCPVVGGIATLTKHTVREHEDGTISVRPGDGSSNSIMVSAGSRRWHGYIEHGVWREV